MRRRTFRAETLLHEARTRPVMPISIAIDESRRRIHVTVHGDFSYADAVSYLEQRRDRGLLGYAALIDCGDADTGLTTDEIRSLVELRRRLMGEQPIGPTAIVAQRDVLFGMLRMYQILTDDAVSLHVTRTLDDAERWLAATDTVLR